MKLPLTWIETYTPLNTVRSSHHQSEGERKSSTLLAHEYSIHTAEIDDVIETFSHELIVVAKVESVRKHENSDRLNIVMVDAGIHGKRQIVCGAPNAPQTQFAALALPGADLGGGFIIAESRIRGELSQGMLCGADEIGLTKERSGGIMQLETFGWSKEYLCEHVGLPFFECSLHILKASDHSIRIPMRETIFEIDNKFITNRPDLFGVEGNAREFATLYKLDYSPLNLKRKGDDNANLLQQNEGDLSMGIISKEAFDAVSSYELASYHLLGKNTETPDSLKILLSRLDESTHEVIADLTTLVMYESAAPMHAYDSDSLQGDLRVRFAHEGESFEALNGKTYSLTSQDIVIADDDGIACLAGIIGAKRTAINKDTTRFSIECGCFDATTIRLTSARIGLRTAASMRFEKSQNPHGCKRAIARFEEFLAEFAPSEKQSTKSYLRDITSTEIHLTHEFIEKRIGCSVSPSQVEDILQRLGFGVSYNVSVYQLTIPEHRATKDISIPMDIVEEIARMIGYEHIPSLPITITNKIAPKNTPIATNHLIRKISVREGLLEVYNYSFSNQGINEAVGIVDHEASIALMNPNTTEHTHMRRSMVPWMLECIANNLKKAPKLGFFEIGRIHTKTRENQFMEQQRSILMTYGWSEEENLALLCNLDAQLAQGKSRTHPKNSLFTQAYHPGKVAIIEGVREPLLIAGYIHPKSLQYFQIEGGVFCVEISLTEVQMQSDAHTKYSPLSKYQSTQRELNFITNERFTFGELKMLLGQSHPLISNIEHVANYQDIEKIGEGLVSQTLSFDIISHEKTLTDEELAEIQEAIISSVESQSSARLRRE